MALNGGPGPACPGPARLGPALAISLAAHTALWWWQPVQPPVPAPGGDALQVRLLSAAPRSQAAPEDDVPDEATAETEPEANTAPVPRPEQPPVRSTATTVSESPDVVDSAPPDAQPEPRPEPQPRVTRTAKSVPRPRAAARSEPRQAAETKQSAPDDPSEPTRQAQIAGSAPSADSTAEPEPARVLTNPKPDYPRQARWRGLEGRVLLEVEVRADGRPGRIDIVASSGHAVLDRAALEGLRQWRFQPARRGGRAVDATLRVPVSFRLN